MIRQRGARRLTPEPVHQPTFQNTGAEAQATSGIVVVVLGFAERQATQAAGLRDDLAGLAVGHDGLTPPNGAHAHLAGSDKATLGIVNGDDVRRVGPGVGVRALTIALHDAALGFGDRTVERAAFSEAQDVIEGDCICFRIVVDEGRNAEAGDAQRIFRREAKMRDQLVEG